MMYTSFDLALRLAKTFVISIWSAMVESSKKSENVDNIISKLHMEFSADRAQLERDLFTLKPSKIKGNYQASEG